MTYFDPIIIRRNPVHIKFDNNRSGSFETICLMKIDSDDIQRTANDRQIDEQTEIGDLYFRIVGVM